MTFVSYAQNYEDVLLHRALKDVERGFYIDVGAHDPVNDSVTKAFYDRGWRGINIEPVLAGFERISAARPHDINLNVAAWDSEERIRLFEVVGTGQSTSNRDYARQGAETGHEVVERDVPARPLSAICAEHGVQEVHFLKIDVEGAEVQVLHGFPFDTLRPWIVVVESNRPNSQEQDYEDWEPLLTAHGYAFAFYDGLNRYYLAPHHAERAEAFSVPPNFFDHFVRHSEARAQEQADALRQELDRIQQGQWQARVESLSVELNAAHQQVQAAHQRLEAVHQRLETAIHRTGELDAELNRARLEAEQSSQYLHAVLTSNSWRITWPLRAVMTGTRGPLLAVGRATRWVVRLPKRALRAILVRALQWAMARPRLRGRLSRLLDRFPALKYRLRMLTARAQALGRPERQVVALPGVAAPAGTAAVPAASHGAPAAPLVHARPSRQRTLYCFVDHTVQCPSNTGMQRVTRSLARGLMELGERVRFVCWDAASRKLVFVSRDNLRHLAQWRGPQPIEAERVFYSEAEDLAYEVPAHVRDEGHWLIVPEVTHITYHDAPVTLDLLAKARELGLRTAFVFYDAIPLRRAELRETAARHAEYMRHLMLADLVLPISHWSERDLAAFYRDGMPATFEPTPEIVTIPLSGEAGLMPRMQPSGVDAPARRMILSVGSIESRKNQLTLVDAFDRFCQRHPEQDWELVLVGNLHPDASPPLQRAKAANRRIVHSGSLDDAGLDALYREAAFTVFPSLEEGFGLPILESLWYGKPCVCANFGSMAEVAQGGGCLTVDTRDPAALLEALTRLATDDELRGRLAQEAATRPLDTWVDYAGRVSAVLTDHTDPVQRIGTVFYLIEHTCQHPANSGIQRVVRSLARALQQHGVHLVPVRWNAETRTFFAPTEEDLGHLARWNGPAVSGWAPWQDPREGGARDWLFIPELLTPLAHTDLAGDLRGALGPAGVRIAWVFFDALPWKLRDLYSPQATAAHEVYMRWLADAELVLPISHYSANDLHTFLRAARVRSRGVSERVQPVPLAGDFAESERPAPAPRAEREVVRILCVGTVEPRKNHLALLQAFAAARAQSQRPLELVIAGGGESYPELTRQVEAIVASTAGIRWERSVDDAGLCALYQDCDFTVYPSLDEGFGLPILESLWYGKPCVCADHGAMAEVATEGGCLHADVRDPNALGAALARLVNDPALLERLAAEAHARSFRRWADYARDVLALLARERHTPRLPHAQNGHVADAHALGMVNLSETPLLSLCITTYNRAPWLAKNLQHLTAVLPQASRDLEIVVCDNCSTDDTPQVVLPYLQREDFRYVRNPRNVGMLGNLRVTASLARGKYVWLIGDDDLVFPQCIANLLDVIRRNPGVGLIYLNYAYTREDNPAAVRNLERLFREAIPIVEPGPDRAGSVRELCTATENFFTAIYSVIFRRDHALRAYGQDTTGRPFSSLPTCVPTTHYVLRHMMAEPAYWVGAPQVLINMNVSWLRYAPLWILERVPEILDLAERMGADAAQVDRWRKHNLPGMVHYFGAIFGTDAEENWRYFSASRFVSRVQHLPEFAEQIAVFREIYDSARRAGHPAAQEAPEAVFLGF